MENQEIYEITQNDTLTKARDIIKANKKIAIVIAAVLAAITVWLICAAVSNHMAYKNGKSAFENCSSFCCLLFSVISVILISKDLCTIFPLWLKIKLLNCSIVISWPIGITPLHSWHKRRIVFVSVVS